MVTVKEVYNNWRKLSISLPIHINGNCLAGAGLQKSPCIHSSSIPLNVATVMEPILALCRKCAILHFEIFAHGHWVLDTLSCKCHVTHNSKATGKWHHGNTYDQKQNRSTPNLKPFTIVTIWRYDVKDSRERGRKITLLTASIQEFNTSGFFSSNHSIFPANVPVTHACSWIHKLWIRVILTARWEPFEMYYRNYCILSNL